MKKQEAKATAFHEAGHALTAYRFKHDVGIISIEPKGYKLGYTVCEEPWADGSTDIEQIIVLYAGFAAENKYNPRADILGSADDNEKAKVLLKNTNETEPNLRKEARAIVQTNWEIIEAIADKLFKYKTLTEDEWNIIIDAFDEGADWEEQFYNMRTVLAARKLSGTQ